MSAKMFGLGSRFIVKGDVEKKVYSFEKIEFVNGVPEIHCHIENKKVILEETGLFDLEHYRKPS